MSSISPQLGRSVLSSFGIGVMHPSTFLQLRKAAQHSRDMQLLSALPREYCHQILDHIDWSQACAASGTPFGIISEAPCNMEASAHRRLAKNPYYRWLTPSRVGGVVNAWLGSKRAWISPRKYAGLLDILKFRHRPISLLDARG